MKYLFIFYYFFLISIDGIVDGDFIVEIKCPFGVKDTKTFLEAINSKKVCSKTIILLLK